MNPKTILHKNYSNLMIMHQMGSRNTTLPVDIRGTLMTCWRRHFKRENSACSALLQQSITSTLKWFFLTGQHHNYCTMLGHENYLLNYVRRKRSRLKTTFFVVFISLAMTSLLVLCMSSQPLISGWTPGGQTSELTLPDLSLEAAVIQGPRDSKPVLQGSSDLNSVLRGTEDQDDVMQSSRNLYPVFQKYRDPKGMLRGSLKPNKLLLDSLGPKSKLPEFHDQGRVLRGSGVPDRPIRGSLSQNPVSVDSEGPNPQLLDSNDSSQKKYRLHKGKDVHISAKIEIKRFFWLIN